AFRRGAPDRPPLLDVPARNLAKVEPRDHHDADEQQRADAPIRQRDRDLKLADALRPDHGRAGWQGGFNPRIGDAGAWWNGVLTQGVFDRGHEAKIAVEHHYEHPDEKQEADCAEPP